MSSSSPPPPDIVLDRADPLNLIIHTSAMDDFIDTTEIPPDWSQLSSLWPEQDPGNPNVNSKPLGDFIDFNMASNILDMDLDMGINGIEPSALHLDSAHLAFSGYDDPIAPFPASASPADILASQFPFALHTDSLLDSISGVISTPTTKHRRLSITSSSSSSGPSFSPVPESVPSPECPSLGNGYTSDSTQQSISTDISLDHSIGAHPLAPTTATNMQFAPPDFSNDPVANLAHRVRQSAGVMLAVPMNGTSLSPGQFLSSPSTQQTKLPIPRLQRPSMSSLNGSIAPDSPPKSATSSIISSAASTPPPFTPTSDGVADNASLPSLTTSPSSVSPSIPSSGTRPKTSHTTIERRYRTNLNARIQSLRMAVPALRVLEDRGASKKIKQNLKGGVLIKAASSNSPNGVGAIIAVPGVASPSNPYGEVDVIDERGYVDGVKVARKCSKANVLGKAVEYIRVLKRREMRLRAEQTGLKALVCGLVGGPALLKEWEREWKEKFGGEERDETDECDMDDEADDDEDEDEEEDEGETGRKRKRVKSEKEGLSKKDTKPTLPITLNADGQPEKRKRGRPRKVPLPSANATPVTPAPTTEQPQQQYLLAAFALFSFFNSPLTSSPASNHPHTHKGHVLSPAPLPLAYAPEILSQLTPPVPIAETTTKWHHWVQAVHLFITILLFLSVLGRMTGGFRIGRIKRFMRVLSGTSKDRKIDERVERIILGAEPLPPFMSSLTLYRSLSNDASPITRALFLFSIASSSSTPFLVRRVLKMRARSVWDNASPFQQTKKEDVVLSLTLDEAFTMLSSLSDQDDGANSVIDLLAVHIVKSELGRVLSKMFVSEVNGTKTEEEQEPESGVEHVIEAAKELGGNIGLLAKNVERVSAPTSPSSSASVSSNGDSDSEEEWDDSNLLSQSISSEDGSDGEGLELETNTPHTLLRALILYRSLFSVSSISIEPPTPTTPTPRHAQTSQLVSRTQKKMYTLRKLLGSQIFDSDEVEDARDKVVDLLVDAERKMRVRSVFGM